MKRLLPIALLTILLGLLAHLAVFFIVQIESPPVPDAQEARTVIEFVGDLGQGQDPVLREQALLRDSAPVFMPTRWNLASEMTGVASLREATEVFAPFPARIRLREAGPGSFDGEKPPSKREYFLPHEAGFFLSLFGRNEIPLREVSPSYPAIIAERMGTEVPVWLDRSPLPNSLEALRPAALWNPGRLFLQVREGRVFGVPLIARSTGFTEWDQALQDYLASLAFYSRLDDGYYRITAYP